MKMKTKKDINTDGLGSVAANFSPMDISLTSHIMLENEFIWM